MAAGASRSRRRLQREVDSAYEEIVERLIGDGVAGAESLRNTRNRDRDEDGGDDLS